MPEIGTAKRPCQRERRGLVAIRIDAEADPWPMVDGFARAPNEIWRERALCARDDRLHLGSAEECYEMRFRRSSRSRRFVGMMIPEERRDDGARDSIGPLGQDGGVRGIGRLAKGLEYMDAGWIHADPLERWQDYALLKMKRVIDESTTGLGGASRVSVARRFTAATAAGGVAIVGGCGRIVSIGSQAALAQAIPVPVPTISAFPTSSRSASVPLGPFTFGGSMRAFYFVRQDVPQAGNPNGTVVAPGGTLDVRYAIPHTALRLGTSYTGTQPGDINGPHPQGDSRLVNSLPSFSLSTIDEAFLGYDTLGIAATVGDRFYDYTWLPAADSHIKPAAYQGGDVSFQPIRGLQLGATRVIRYESRTSSNFQPDTLLTAVIPGQPTPPVVRRTAGALRLVASGTLGPFRGRIERYAFYDLATLWYADASWSIAPSSPLKPYLALQGARERESGRCDPRPRRRLARGHRVRCERVARTRVRARHRLLAVPLRRRRGGLGIRSVCGLLLAERWDGRRRAAPWRPLSRRVRRHRVAIHGRLLRRSALYDEHHPRYGRSPQPRSRREDRGGIRESRPSLQRPGKRSVLPLRRRR